MPSQRFDNQYSDMGRWPYLRVMGVGGRGCGAFLHSSVTAPVAVSGLTDVVAVGATGDPHGTHPRKISISA